MQGLPAPLSGMSVHLADRQVGWASVAGGPCGGCAQLFQLFKTGDGGATWTRLGDCDPQDEINFVCATPTP
jgi:hypothetical protein